VNDIEKEQRIISFLKKKYKPVVIVLVGSRAQKVATDKSDWDLYVFTDKKAKSSYIYFENEKLDISIEPLEFSKYLLKNSFSPIPKTSLQILYDESKGAFNKVLTKTEKAFLKGPLALWNDEYKDRIITLERLIDKILKYEQRTEVQYMYASAFYEFASQAYFETRNMWTPTPIETFNYFQKNDKRMLMLMSGLRTSDGAMSTKTARLLLKHIQNL